MRRGALGGLIALTLTLAFPVLAQDMPWMAPLKAAYRERIRNLVTSREKALGLAASGNADELRAVKELLAATAQPLDQPPLEGRYRCRTYQLGGMAALTANPFYECRIYRDGKGNKANLVLEKTTGGTLRRAFLLRIEGNRMLMYGSTRAQGEAVKPYGADDYRDEAGVLERIGPNRLRIELPEPRAYNSAKHEVIELFGHKFRDRW